jgi:hypothetical protein
MTSDRFACGQPLVAQGVDNPIGGGDVFRPQAGRDDSIATAVGGPDGHRSFHLANFGTSLPSGDLNDHDQPLNI